MNMQILQNAATAHRNGNIERALELYQIFLAKNPEFPPALNGLGTVLLDKGDIETAEILFANAAQGANPYIPALYNLARIKQAKGFLSEAKEIYEKLLALEFQSGLVWNNLGLILRMEGRLQEARKALEKAIKYMSKYPEAYNNLGVVLEALELFEEAERAFLRAVELKKGYFSAYFNLGCLYHKQKRYNEAVKYLKMVLSRNPNEPSATYLLQSMGVLPMPERAPMEYVSKTFDDCAVSFEKILLNKLEYQTPQKLFSLLNVHLKRNSTVLDLGCGTGLGAEYYKPYSSFLCGMDCSHKMLDLARQKGIYDKLILQDIIEDWKIDKQFDCIYSSDCLVYFGNLSPVMEKIKTNLAPNGILGFSVELLEIENKYMEIRLGQSGRFAHSKDYIYKVMKDYKICITDSMVCTLRKEEGKPVRGLLVVAINES